MRAIRFTAKWCGPCQRLAPIVDALMREKGVEVKVVDVDEDQAMAHQWAVTSLPTVVVLDDGGVEIERAVGGGEQAVAKLRAVRARSQIALPYSRRAELRYVEEDA